MLPWALCAVLALIVIALCIRLHLIHKSLKEIDAQLTEILAEDTTVLIDLSSGDQQLRSFAAALNRQLRLLRTSRQRYRCGDRELKDAVTNISHDLRTPLTAICGYLELLRREETNENVTRYLGLIDNRARAMKQLTEELFRYSMLLAEPEELPCESVNLNAALEEGVAAFYDILVGRGIRPEIRMQEAPIVRTLNAAALSRILSNILNNAVKYSDGDLSIELDAGGAIRFSNSARNLTPVQAEKLFDRFYTVESARNSTGLGLSIARLLTERMGGEIHLACEGGRLCIELHFPELPPESK